MGAPDLDALPEGSERRQTLEQEQVRPALTLMPVLCSYLLTGRVREEDNGVIRLIKQLYQPSLQLVLNRPWIITLSTILWTALSVFAFLQLGAEFVPKLDEGSHTEKGSN